jgi:hypothetical protein
MTVVVLGTVFASAPILWNSPLAKLLDRRSDNIS